MYKPGQFLYQAVNEHKETGHVSRRNLVGGLVELLGGAALAGGSVIVPKPAQAFERNPDGYPIPDLTGLTPYKRLTWDVEDTIPGKETLIERYILNDRTKVARLSVNGEVFAYSVKDAHSAKGYGIVASTKPGQFTEKYNDNEGFGVPDWLVRKTLLQRKGMKVSKK